MSIATMKKISLVGAVADKPGVLGRLQELGCMHLVPFQAENTSDDEAQPSGSKQAMAALRYLLDARVKRHQLRHEEDFDILAVTAQALENRQRKLEVQEVIDDLHDRIGQVEAWGDFSPPSPDRLGGQRLWFYVVPHYQLRQIAIDAPWEVVHRDHRNSYVVVVAESEPRPASMPVARTRMDARSLSELERDLGRAESEMEDIRGERWALTRFITLMIQNLARADDASALVRASKSTLDGEEVFALTGWVPAERVDDLAAFAESEGLAWLVEEPTADEDPPVLLDNPPGLQAGEDLVAFYQIPSYRDWDPSPVVYVSFALFFGMIVADAAYGFVIGLIGVFAWKRMSRTASLRRGRKLLFLVAAASTAYGALVGSYFGVVPAPQSLLSAVHVLDVNDFDSMMRLSIGVGIGHLILANAVTAWGRRREWAALAPVGWMWAFAGGFAFYIGAESVGMVGVTVGLLLVFLFTSERRVQRASDVLWRVIDGLQGLTGVSRAFGDVLSYLRLFALGLSSASLAVTFNQLGSDIMSGGAGLALLVGLLVVTVGHGLNLTLAIVSGVVHGLRLNVIELYNWSVFGEGKPFEAFEKREATVMAESRVRGGQEAL